MSGKTDKKKKRQEKKKKQGFDQTIDGIADWECKWINLSDLKNELKQGVLGGTEWE